ncbi:MAG TPA: type II secretion system F family protein [Candidatus Angelobacter sp.]|nr:type II secretion system F family protein [Candidatus Angelobacter sp.]
MNYDEFAFFNQQLAAMLRDGIPLEGALDRLCADMRQGALRSELEKLGADLSKGRPMGEALRDRQLPDLYKRLVTVGAKSNDMPSALTLLADYYQNQHNLWTRLKGLMVYPTIVLVAAFLVSVVFYYAWTCYLLGAWKSLFGGFFEGAQLPAATRASMPLIQNLWIFPVFFGGLCLVVLAILFVPRLRQAVGWRLPAFREARLANTASTISLLLKGGLPLPDTFGLVEHLESNVKTRQEIGRWSQNLSSGMTKFSQIAGGGQVFPPLFVWLVSSAGEDLAAGFRQAADIYRDRAAHRSEILLFAALPLAVLVLGIIILTQGWLIVSGFLVFVQLMNAM